MMLSILSCVCWQSVYLLWRNDCSDLCPFFNWIFLLLSCMSSLYILDISSLPDTWRANIFSHSLGCLFVCWWLPLLWKSFLVWCSPTYLFLLLFLLLLVSDSKNHYWNLCQGGYCLCFLPGVLLFQVYVQVFNTFWVYFCV